MQKAVSKGILLFFSDSLFTKHGHVKRTIPLYFVNKLDMTIRQGDSGYISQLWSLKETNYNKYVQIFRQRTTIPRPELRAF